MCLGFWSGVLLAIFAYTLLDIGLVVVLLPFASSCLSWAFDIIMRYYQSATELNDKMIQQQDSLGGYYDPTSGNAAPQGRNYYNSQQPDMVVQTDNKGCGNCGRPPALPTPEEMEKAHKDFDSTSRSQ
jgi:hypothetical protein